LKRRRHAAATSDKERGITIIRAASAVMGSMVATNVDALAGAYSFEIPLRRKTEARRKRAAEEALERNSVKGLPVACCSVCEWMFCSLMIVFTLGSSNRARVPGTRL
jgi:hypothetical protein